MDVFGTSFLPNTLYLHRFVNAQQPIIDIGEHFVKQTQRNRTFILSANGSIPMIVPLRKNAMPTGKQDSRTVSDMEISYAEDWQMKTLRAIRSSYLSSPYYEHYQQEFEDLLMRNEQRLHDYNRGLFGWLLRELHINKPASYITTYIENGIVNDYRNIDFFAKDSYLNAVPYKQVFSHKTGFIAGLSVVDLLFNKGPEALPYLK